MAAEGVFLKPIENRVGVVLEDDKDEDGKVPVGFLPDGGVFLCDVCDANV